MTILTTAILCAARVALALGCAAAAAATRVDLNLDWSFIADPDGSGEKSGWVTTAPAQAAAVRLPHSWNRPGAHHDYLGLAWYFRDLDLPKLPPDANVQLNFGATFYQARVWVNGAPVGSHEGYAYVDSDVKEFDTT